MLRNKNDSLINVPIAIGALLVGVAFGHWGVPVRVATPSSVPPQLPSATAGLTSAATSAPLPGAKAGATKAAPHSDPAALAGLLAEHGGGTHLMELTDFVANLAPGDFASALLAARKLPGSADRDLATRLLIARWAEVDPDGALAFAANHREFDQITGTVFQQLAATDLQGALTRAQAISDPNLRYQALRAALGVMAENDPAGALRLAANAGNLPNNESLSQMIYRQWAWTDPAAAAAAAAQDSSGSTGWRSPLGQVIRTWASQDPQGALSFALTMTDPAAQSRSIGDIIRNWGEQDPAAAAAWVNTVPAGSVRDAAAAALASSVASTDVQTAVGWAQSISDEAARTSALQRVSRRVIWRDPTNGPSTLQSAGVPPEIIENLPPPRGR